MEEITITIQDKKPYTGGAGSPPAGDFWCDKVKYTSWLQDDFNKYNVGDTVVLHYTSKDNTHEGRRFTNRNISRMESLEASEPTQNTTNIDTEYQNAPQTELKAGSVTINGSTYEVFLRLI